jgi:flavin-dependent dehydrogenase
MGLNERLHCRPSIVFFLVFAVAEVLTKTDFDMKNAEYNFDTMIVGGGPAGVSTWLHLEKYAPEVAYRTVLIESATFPRDKVCAGGVGGWSADVLDHLDVKLDIPSLFISHVEFRYENRSFHLHRPNFFRIVQRSDFDHALVKIAVSRGLNIHQNERITDVVGDKDWLTVTTNKARYKVQVLVGADGALSVVRRKIMPSSRLCLAPTIQMVSAVNMPFDTEFSEEKIVLDLGPVSEGLQGYLWHIPCLRDNLPFMAHGICDFRIHRAKPRAKIKKIFAHRLASRNIDPDPKLWSSHPIRWFSSEDLVSRPRVLLVGDAAGIEPAFGGGIHLALSYGEVAARTIVDAFTREEFSFKNYSERIESHMMGQWIQECTETARQMYGGELNPLKASQQLFAQREITKDFVSLMLSEIKKKIFSS